jgi:cytosine/adenosine deaminase-related metal-dependent hydrolase
MILLKNGTYINWQTLEFKTCDILVEEGLHGGIRFYDAWKAPAGHTSIDCTGKFVTHAFANGHHHVYSALARGMNPPKKNPENFPEILDLIWWTLDKSLDQEMIYSSALVTAIACAKNGVSFVIDHHASPNSVTGSLDAIAKAFEEVGIGHLLCYEISDRDGDAIAEQGLVETENYIKKRQGLVGLHASFTVGDHTLKNAIDLAKRMNSGIHVHVAEDKSDEDHCKKNYNLRIIERFKRAGILDLPKSIFGHCIHLDPKEREMLSQSDVWVVQNTESNLNNQVGNFNSEGLGPNIMLGTDGMHSDMLRSAKMAFFSGHNFDRIDYGETYRRFRNVHHYLKKNNFEGDGDNNIVVLDYDTPTPLTPGNFLGHFLFGVEGKHVSHLTSSGKLILKDHKVITVDEEKILGESMLQAKRLWNRMSGQK